MVTPEPLRTSSRLALTLSATPTCISLPIFGPRPRTFNPPSPSTLSGSNNNPRKFTPSDRNAVKDAVAVEVAEVVDVVMENAVVVLMVNAALVVMANAVAAVASVEEAVVPPLKVLPQQPNE